MEESDVLSLEEGVGGSGSEGFRREVCEGWDVEMGRPERRCWDRRARRAQRAQVRGKAVLGGILSFLVSVGEEYTKDRVERAR